MLHFGLAGNPNCGKTTLFNQLTGSNAHVGNWPGVTVDRKEGKYRGNAGEEINIIDLPGIYSLSPYTPEEIIARNFIIEDTPDLIINIIDATNIERNLYLTTQILETDCPVVIAMNMMDLVERNGDSIDLSGLSQIMGIPVIPISAARSEGMQELMETAVKAAKQQRQGHSVLSASWIGKEIDKILEVLKPIGLRHPVFNGVKLLEADSVAMKNPLIAENLKQIEKIRQEVIRQDKYGDMEALIADLRYRYITEYCVPLIRKKRKDSELAFSGKIDRLLTHKILGLPVFFLFMFFIFHLTFSEKLFGMEGVPSLGVWLQSLAESGVNAISAGASSLFVRLGAADWVFGLVIDGMISGVGAVLSFVPQILCLFLFLSILEDSGYLARVAFLMDRILRNFGLSGRAFLPLLMGFGCSVPAIMASRILESERERRLTMMIVPYMSCGAKLPIYALFAAALFQKNSDRIIFGMYLIGIVVAVTAAIILKRTILKAEASPFILELPTYHMPSIKSLSLLLWEKLKDYVVRAGTVILASTIIIWFLSNFSFAFHMVEANSSQSMLGSIGGFLVPFFRPLGFAGGGEGWKAIVAILTGLIAKEAVVSTMGVLYNPTVNGDAMESDAARQALLLTVAGTFSPLAAVSFMAFNLLSVPCMAAVSAMRAEMKSVKWTFITIGFWIGTAWITCFLIFQIGTLLGL